MVPDPCLNVENRADDTWHPYRHWFLFKHWGAQGSIASKIAGLPALAEVANSRAPAVMQEHAIGYNWQATRRFGQQYEKAASTLVNLHNSVGLPRKVLEGIKNELNDVLCIINSDALRKDVFERIIYTESTAIHEVTACAIPKLDLSSINERPSSKGKWRISGSLIRNNKPGRCRRTQY